MGFGASWLAPRLHAFLDAYPDVTMQLLLDDTDLDLAMREADVAIRMHAAQAARSGAAPSVVDGVAHLRQPEYLKQHGTPMRPEDLDDHRLILFGNYRPPVEDVNWLAEAGRRPGPPHRAVLEVNSLHGMMMAIRSGLGIAAIPDYMAVGNDGLVRDSARHKGAEGGRLFRLSRGVAQFQAGRGIPRFSAGATGRASTLTAAGLPGCGK